MCVSNKPDARWPRTPPHAPARLQARFPSGCLRQAWRLGPHTGEARGTDGEREATPTAALAAEADTGGAERGKKQGAVATAAVRPACSVGEGNDEERRRFFALASRQLSLIRRYRPRYSKTPHGAARGTKHRAARLLSRTREPRSTPTDGRRSSPGGGGDEAIRSAGVAARAGHQTAGFKWVQSHTHNPEPATRRGIRKRTNAFFFGGGTQGTTWGCCSGCCGDDDRQSSSECVCVKSGGVLRRAGLAG